MIGIVLFQTAYMAETIRGGLQTIPKGQYEAAASLGLSKYQIYTSVILPQALVTVIPAFVNNLLSTFMDTSLVTIVSMYDLTRQSASCFGRSQLAQFLLRRLSVYCHHLLRIQPDHVSVQHLAGKTYSAQQRTSRALSKKGTLTPWL